MKLGKDGKPTGKPMTQLDLYKQENKELMEGR